MNRLRRDSTLLLIVDIQERLASAMPKDDLARMTRSVVTLIGGAAQLGVPILYTEQYPKGIGRTLPEIGQALQAASSYGLVHGPIEKLHFSCYGDDGVRAALKDPQKGAGRNQILVCGMETHVCVFQTVRDLVGASYEVHVPADAVCSRSADNRQLGLSLMARAGGIVTSTETVLFDLLEKAGSPEFKAISALIK